MNKKETSPLHVIVRPKEKSRKKRTGNAEKDAPIPKTIHAGIQSFPLPPSNTPQLIRIALQIQIVDME